MKEIREDRLVCFDKVKLAGIINVLEDTDVSNKEKTEIREKLFEEGEENAKQYKKVQ